MKYVFLFSLLLGQVAFSADEVVAQDLDVKPAKMRSSDNRKDKRFMITGEIVGQGPSGSYGQGLNLGYFFNPNSILMLELNGGHSSTGDGFLFSFDGQTNKTGYSLGIISKNFVGNSFYLKGGLAFRTLDYEYIDKDWINGGKTSRSFKGDSTSISLGLGNQWQGAGFTIGVDWFGLELPINSRVYDVEYSANATANTRNRNREDVVKYVTGVGITLLRLSMGASF